MAEGSLTIGAHVPGRESVVQAPVLNNVFGSGWTTYVDAMSVNGQDIPFGKSNLPFTPQGKLIAIFDTGTTAGILPSALVDAIYSRIPGALETDDQWLVPCAGAANVTFTIGYVTFIRLIVRARANENQRSGISYASARPFLCGKWTGST